MSVDSSTSMRASRYRVARSRGAASGVLLVLLGAWAALAPFIGPYLNLAYTPQPNTAWHWTAARGWLEVLPGAVVALAGILLIVSASRVVTSFAAWLAAAGGAWLVVGPAVAPPLRIHLGTPDPTSRRSVQSLEQLLFFYGVGAVIVFLAGLALGRLTVKSLRDVRAAERRLAADDEAAAAAADRPVIGQSAAPGYDAQRGASGRHGRPEPGGRETGSDTPTSHAPTTQTPTTQTPTTQQPPVGQPAGAQPAPSGGQYGNPQTGVGQPPAQQPGGVPTTQQPGGAEPSAQRPTYAAAPPPPPGSTSA